MKFEELQLAPALTRAVADKGYVTATPIQADAIPPILAGRDLIGCAQTGTGKTAAFALPTLERIYASIQREKSHGPAAKTSATDDRRPRGHAAGGRRKTRALVLAPTRELVSQIAESFAAYGKHTPLRLATIFGGVSQVPQVKALQHGVDVIVATPGRLLDLMQQGRVDLNGVEVLIFDEADQMLDMGFLPDLRRIVARVPPQRQTLMFSATMPDPIRRLAQEWLVDPVSVATAPIAAPAEKVDQSVYFVQKKEKTRLLAELLERTPTERTLVFTRTKHGADKVVKHLLKARFRAAAIHGNKSQGARERALEQFKSSRPPVLVATDIAARGLHVTGVSHVINFDLPETPETYVHRIGRTARAGASGAALSFCSVEEIGLLRAIERLTRRRIDAGADHAEYRLELPSAETLAASAGETTATTARGGTQRRPGRGRRPAGGGRRPAGGSRRSADGHAGARRGGSATQAHGQGSTQAGAAPAAPPARRKRRHLSRP